MTDEQAQKLVEELSFKYFHRPFLHRAYFNSRLKTTGGRYMLQSHDIQLNKTMYEYFGIEELRGIILHELCHYHLHLLGKGYKHRDSDFRELLLKVGAPRFCSLIENTEEEVKKKTIHYYKCMDCGQLYKRKKRMDTKKYCCSICKGKIEFFESNTL